MVNNNYIFFAGHDCNKNIPVYVELEAGESKLYKTTLVRSIKFEHPCKNCVYGTQVEATKLGLIVVNDISKREGGNSDDYDLGMDDRSKWKLFWSNPLFLLGKQPQAKTIQLYKD